MMITYKTSEYVSKKTKLLTMLLYAMVINLLFASISLAHDNNNAHPGLTNAAISIVGIQEVDDHGFFDVGVDPQCSFIDEGSVKEDLALTSFESWDTSVWGTHACWLFGLNWVNHAYNPITGGGWWNLGGIDALGYALPIWEEALTDYSSGDKDAAYFGLGRVCHLLEDMTSVAHVHGDVHVPLLDPDDFEEWGKIHFDNYDFSTMALQPYIPSGNFVLPDGSTVLGSSIQGFMQSMAMFTYDLSSFHVGDFTWGLDPPESELKRMSGNTLHWDWLELGWHIEDVGYYYPDPRLSDWWECDGDPDYYYLENIDEFTPAVFEKTLEHATFIPGMSLCEIYGDELYPEAVQHCAGLLEFFTSTVSTQAICVPWQPTDPTIAHYTYSGAEITLKGIARGEDATEYRWDFGDSGSTSWAPISNSYNLGVKHTYNGPVGQLFIATLYVRDQWGNESQDEYPVRIYESSDLSNTHHLDVRINMAVDEGLWYLHRTMNRVTYAAGSPGYEQPYGWWTESYGYPVASVGTAVDAFQLHGSRANGDYDNDPYVETVQRGLNYLLYNTYAYSIGPQSHGDPDTNGNGIGLVANNSSSLYNTRQTYVGGIAFVALASSGAPNRDAAVGRTNVVGRKYSEIVQDMVDFFAWGQVDSGSGRGGWRYHANYSTSDMSTTQWPPMGMIAAEKNMASNVPDFVRDELSLYLNAQQNMALNNDNGGFKYDYRAWYNITKTAAGIICHEFLGTSLTDAKVESAIGFVYRHWNDTGTSWDHTKLHGNSYGMYGLMKACRIPNPDITKVTEYAYWNSPPNQTGNTFDWYYTPAGQSQQGLATYCVATQQADGSWDDNVGSNKVYDAFATGWRILILLEGVVIIPPQPIVSNLEDMEFDINQDILLDGSSSFHPDKNRTIVGYEWDFSYNSFVADACGPIVTIEGGFSEVGVHLVALRVTDDNPDYLGGPQSNMIVFEILIHPPCHDPHAFADGPYIGWIEQPVVLDASASWDPDSENLTYEWDLDSDGLFGTEDDDCFGEPSDAVGVNPEWTWHAPYFGVIGLRVTDDGCFADPTYYTGSDFDFTTIEIGNHAPVSDPGGPYEAGPDSTITLDGSASYDPDPGAVLSYAWDLDNDGQFDDSSAIQPDFTGGAVIGMVYDICLKVTDQFGESDTACTTVEIAETGPQPVDDFVNTSLGRVGYDRRTGRFSVSVTVTNTSAEVIDEPLWLVIESISNPDVTLANTDGTTADGKEYLDLTGLLGDGQLAPGESVITRVYFNNPSRVRFSFEPSVRGVILP